MTELTFKRAKRVIALHYGSCSFKTRRLCQLFSNVESLSKQERIVREATRIIELRRSLGFEVTDAGIDVTMQREVMAQRGAHIGGLVKSERERCLTCKQSIASNGWLVDTSSFPACPGDCTMIARFYYTSTGAKLPACKSFKAKYGTALHNLSARESFDAMLSYMVHLTATRVRKQQNEAQFRNPTNRSV